MAYEYEEYVLNELTQTALDERDNIFLKLAQEVEEVYRKAKAFDEILNITQLQHEEEYADNVISVINKYKEDK
ncbi:DUF1024 family protein [Staphylococcus equorum]|uniref:DUF1024 family protein n=1 Tax=Staphylococcus equorum TaxID=246432 RepID=UPI0024087D0E|nr:DUF1024 family protein [Staphylococcus equorum]MDG0821354.1 DUF1024 family protein [Staphylococcus equorum]